MTVISQISVEVLVDVTVSMSTMVDVKLRSWVVVMYTGSQVGHVVATLLVGGATVMVETSVIVDAGIVDVKNSSRVLVRGAKVSVTVTGAGVSVTVMETAGKVEV